VLCNRTVALQLKKDKVELENQLEQEQEALVNRLWKRMDKLEAEKRFSHFDALVSYCKRVRKNLHMAPKNISQANVSLIDT